MCNLKDSKVIGILQLSIVSLLVGCSTPSVITLKDNRQIQTTDVPKLDKAAGFYRFKQLNGKKVLINKDVVLTIREL